MRRRPPRSTRTDTLFPLHDALPIWLASEDAAGRTAIVHLKSLHPLDDHYGLGCVGAAAGAVAIHNAATVWNKALLDNAARPSGALVYDPGEAGEALSGEQFARLKAEMEADFQGAGNAEIGRASCRERGCQYVLKQVVA